MAILSKVIYQYSADSIKTPTQFFTEIKKKNLKSYMEIPNTQENWNSFEQQNASSCQHLRF